MSFNDRFRLRKNILISFLILIVGIFYSYYMMGASIWPTNTWHWESAGGDNTQHYIGWLAYRQDQWHWPLTYTNRLNNPTGTSIVFTDSIPLFGVLLKIFNDVLPENFQYFGLFILLGYILQYGFGFLLLRYFCSRSLLIPLLGAGFFLVSPIMSHRIGGHESLTAHWLILASIYIYCQALNPIFKRWVLPSFSLLIFLSLGIHFYLASMVLVLGIITLFQSYWLEKTKRNFTDLTKILGLLIVFVISLYLWGYFIGHASAGSEVVSSLNLNSFINSQNRSKFIPGLGYIKPFQWEGFAYLGLGVLILLPFSIFISIRSSFLSYSYRWLPLIILVSLLVIFALGNKVYFGEILIWKLPDFPLLQKTYSIFRGAGRFAWPFYYTLLLGIIVSISRIKNRYFLIGLLVASLIIQISDISPLRSASMLNQNKPIIFPENSLKEIKNIKKHTNSDYFWILPPSSCPGGLGYSDRTLLFAAVKSHLITNDNNGARIIRGSYRRDCDLIQQLKQINQLRKDTLYAINKNQATPDFLLDTNKPENRNKCKALPKENWLLCHREGLSKESITEQVF